MGGGPVDRGPDDRSGPDSTADEFEAIVAGLRREGVPAWPSDDRPPAEPRTPPMAVPPVHPSWSGPPHVESDTDRFDHYVPPEPPPLPRIGPPAAVGMALLVLGLTLVISPGVVGIPDVYGLPLGLLALASGLGWLVLRLWPAPPDDRGEDDDGAML
jgi:hypothetical protein